MSDVEAILKMHKDVIDAHKNNDVDALFAIEAEEIVRVSRGEVLYPSKKDRFARFKWYFEHTEFEEYRDLVEPIVRVSEDGTLGWLIAQVKIVGTQTDDDGEQSRIDSVWAWIELYEKKNGRWYRTGDVSNLRPDSG
jgi:ketosteroid isomerase-like protein